MSDELMTKVQELIDSTINPAVAGQGGFVQLLGVRGACPRCGVEHAWAGASSTGAPSTARAVTTTSA